MAVTFPVIFTPVDDLEVSYPNAVDEETVRKLIQNANLVGRLAPIGTIRAFALNQPGVTAPDSRYWQVCDGTEITNPSSPLRSIGLTHNFTPDLRSKFIMGANSATTNPTGGTSSVGLAHSHGGQTHNYAPGFDGSGDVQVTAMHNHAHSISTDLGAESALDPAHQLVALYIKIN